MRIPLNGGTYKARSAASSAQRCLNLIPETPPPGEDNSPWPHYLTPGLVTVAAGATAGFGVRGFYFRGTPDGIAIVVIGGAVYGFNVETNVLTQYGSITAGTSNVSMMGSGTGYVVICDGLPGHGWYLTPTNTVVTITDPNFFGAKTVCFLDTFMLFNDPNTNLWYSSPSNYSGNSTPFDPLYVATKSTYLDIIQGLATVSQVVWVIGNQTTELWVDSGAADFPFQRVPEVLFQYGTVAPYSIATADESVFFLSQDLQGRNIVMQGRGYQLQRISQPSIEWAWAQYTATADAVGMTYSQDGHTFYVLTFPTGDHTFVYDLSTQLWHQRCTLDAEGNEHQHRMNCVISVGNVYCGDYVNGNIYRLDPLAYTDNTIPIKRQRVFPHALNDGNRATYWRFMADMGTTADTTDNITLDWSDDRGTTFGNPLVLPLNNALDGGGLTWWRLGTARDRVFRLTWTAPVETMLQGAWIDVEPCAT